MVKKTKYRIYCTDVSHEGWQYTDYTTTAPTECPVNSGHTVNPDSVQEYDVQDIIEKWIFVDKKNNAHNGGTFTQKQWSQRDLNTVVESAGPEVTLGTNDFTLQSGTYSIKVNTPANNVKAHRCRLYNITDSEIVAYGSSEYATNFSTSLSMLEQIVEITAPKTFKVEHRCSKTRNNYGKGRSCGFGDNEYYTKVTITKLL